jgi:hypothetical protein
MGCVTSVYRKIKKHVAEWNSFEDVTCRSDSFHLRTAIISTRVYIALLTASVTIIVAFLSLGDESKVNTIRNPSEETYQDLLRENATSLSCPCSRVTVPYLNFTWTTVDYHPVCSSVFVSQELIDRLFSPNIGRLYQGDFRALASNLFQLLAAFCSHAKRSVNDALEDFHSDTLLTTDVLLPESFKTQVQAYSEFLRLSTTNSVRRLLQSVRSTTQANGLQTVIQTSQILLKQIGGSFHVIRTDVDFFDFEHIDPDRRRCKCKSSVNCSTPLGFYENEMRLAQSITLSNMPIANLTGFLVGCNPVESLLRSTLECLFNSSCLNTIHRFIPSSNITSAYALNTGQTNFAPNMFIEELINELFIQNWTTNQSFSHYFAQCAPILCTYISIQRNNALFVLTKLLGFYGGLTAALRMCVPAIIGWWRKRKIINSEEPHPSE